MVIDTHVHVLKADNFDAGVEQQIRHRHPEDTPFDELVTWLREAGVVKAVLMGQDMSRMWNSTCGEDYVRECIIRYPDFFVGLASVEPVDRWGRFNRSALKYFEEAVTIHGFRGLLLTPPYGHYRSDDPQVYPFYEKAMELDAIVQFHHCANPGGIFLAPYKYAKPEALNNVLIDFPGLKVVVEHLNYPREDELFFMMMNHDVNVYADLAMTYNRPTMLTWNLVKAKEMGIMDRIMYGSDYWVRGSGVFSQQPGDDMKRWIQLLRTGINETADGCGWPDFTQEDIDGILYKNAAQLYGFTNI